MNDAQEQPQREAFTPFAATMERTTELSKRVSVEFFVIHEFDKKDRIRERAEQLGFDDWAILEIVANYAGDFSFPILLRLKQSYSEEEIAFIDKAKFTEWLIDSVNHLLSEQSLCRMQVSKIKSHSKYIAEIERHVIVVDPQWNPPTEDPALTKGEEAHSAHLTVPYGNREAGLRMIDDFRKNFDNEARHREQIANRRKVSDNQLTADSVFPLYFGDGDQATEVHLLVGAQPLQPGFEHDGWFTASTPWSQLAPMRTYFKVVKGVLTPDNLGAFRIETQRYIDNYLITGTKLLDVILAAEQLNRASFTKEVMPECGWPVGTIPAIGVVDPSAILSALKTTEQIRIGDPVSAVPASETEQIHVLKGEAIGPVHHNLILPPSPDGRDFDGDALISAEEAAGVYRIPTSKE